MVNCVTQKDVFRKHPGALTHAPLTIITNRDSGSASEVYFNVVEDSERRNVLL